MEFLYFLFLIAIFGGGLGMLGLAGVGLALFFWGGSVGMDGLFSAGTPRGELTCWHCGEQTRAGVKRCTHCGGELQ